MRGAPANLANAFELEFRPIQKRHLQIERRQIRIAETVKKGTAAQRLQRRNTALPPSPDFGTGSAYDKQAGETLSLIVLGRVQFESSMGNGIDLRVPKASRDTSLLSSPGQDAQLKFQIKGIARPCTAKRLQDLPPLGLIGTRKLNVVRERTITLLLAQRDRRAQHCHRQGRKKAGGAGRLPKSYRP